MGALRSPPTFQRTAGAAADPSAGDRNATCTVLADTSFEFFQDDASLGTKAVDSTGTAWIELVEGQIRISETLPDSADGIFVTCDHSTANQVQTIEPTINSDGSSITLAVSVGDSLSCDFFATSGLTAAAPIDTEADAPDDADADAPVDADTDEADTGTTDTEVADTGEANGSSTVTVQQWDCPSALAPADSESDLLISCETSGAENGLTLTDNAQSSEIQSDDVGSVTWSDIAPGTATVTIGSDVAIGTVEPAVFCSSSTLIHGQTVDIFPQQITATGGSITIEIDAASEVYCDWFRFSD